MSALEPVKFFLVTGNYLLVWPLYRVLHPKNSQRRCALLKLFLYELSFYSCITGFLLLVIIKAWHHHFPHYASARLLYLLLLILFWVTTVEVWVKNTPESEP